ncbi:unnamed protein product, partial [Brenthis ino]
MSRHGEGSSTGKLGAAKDLSSEHVLSVARRDGCVCGAQHPVGRVGGWGGVYRSSRGACAAARAGGGGPRDYSQCHPRSPQLAARRATASATVRPHHTATFDISDAARDNITTSNRLSSHKELLYC